MSGLVILLFTFSPLIKEEITYAVTPKKTIEEIKPRDMNFGIVIPQINANAKVIANVDPYNEKEYQYQLSKGVAHAKGSSMPNEYGNTFLFAHSAADWQQATRYNAIFYLIYKLKNNDRIYIFYMGKKYTFRVNNVLYVSDNEISYLTRKTSVKSLILMTCWPPGTSLKRLLVQAILIQ